MPQASVLLHNHFQNSYPSHLKAIQQVKEDQFSKFLAPLEIMVIPGFGPVYIKVMLVATMLNELRSSFSKGLDPKRIGPYDPKVVCYQNHPL